MMDITKILETAQNRAKELGVCYKGALLPSEAYRVLQAVPEARIVDVRCRAELDWVGRIPGAIEVELLTYPGMQSNPGFPHQLSGQVADDAVLLFICRTGVRSDKAATLMGQYGFTNCYNVLEGFEGEKDEIGHRGLKNGWKAAGLPWIQG
ncbi:rhodanese-like domain-containing protein [Nitrosomonas sp. HPC101]|uniref:rhodanese-like domain-containing protein n=1 Tax=Nitrosomonas sp. HPC101 TaxID=1658667 RepID=UPI001369E8B4|nr:rhodanese-like domain-containing protein [Nitrosomonas sp. HPC101]MXS86259.1 rhodanese-like domain-containing protein [Nitrosomonas sp. HPC101]